MRSAFFIDLDGTLLTDDYKLTPENIEAISNAEKAEINTYLVTGQTYESAIKYYEQLSLRTTLICNAGQAIFYPDGTREFISIDYEDMNRVVKEVSKLFKIVVTMVGSEDGNFHVSEIRDSNMINLVKKCNNVLEGLSNFSSSIMTLIEVESMPNSEIRAHLKKLNMMFDKELVFAYFDTDGFPPIIQVRPTKAGKWNIIKKIIKRDNIKYTYAFGNGWSDKEMIQKSDEGYAMINSAEPIKKYADHVTEKDNNCSGVGFEINKIIQMIR